MKKIFVLLFTILSFFPAMCNAINWSTPPNILSSAMTNGVDPRVAMDASGNAFAIWIENNTVMFSTKAINGTWSNAVSISGHSASNPCLVCDSLGNCTALWLYENAVQAASRNSSGSWSAPINLSTGNVSAPDLAVAPSGDVIAVWIRRNNIESAFKPRTANWQSVQSIQAAGAIAPQVALGGVGSQEISVIVWHNDAKVVYTSTKTVPGNWNSPQALSNIGENAINPQVAIDDNSNAIAIWYAYDVVGPYFSNVVVQSALKPAKFSWGSAVNLSDPGMIDPSMLRAKVGFDSIGNAIALWNTSFDGKTFHLQSAVKPVRNNFGAPTNLVSSNLYAYSADFSVPSFGEALSIYMFYNGASLLIQSSESDISGFRNGIWSVPVNVSTGPDNAFPSVVAARAGNQLNAVAVWTGFNGVNKMVLSSTGNRTIVSPPTNLNVIQSAHYFGGFSEFFNTLSWNASPDAEVQGYLIYRNGTFLQRVPSNVLLFIDNNQGQNKPVLYTVEAINSQNLQSFPVNVSFP